MSEAPPDIPGHRLLARIGQGAYGEVFLAEDTTGRRVAAKVVSPREGLSEKMLQRELAGLKRFLAAAQSHAYVVRMHRLIEGLPGGGFACIMELADSVHGEGVGRYEPLTLRHRLKAEHRLPVTEALRIAMALCEALEHLHARGLVHRDIKPSNVIFVHGQPKLADLGLVAGDGDSTSAVGTQGYHPPEGMRGPRGDLFGLGKVLYEMVTGCDRQDFPELPEDFRSYPDARDLLGLNPVFERACAANPARRYPSASHFRRDLARLAAGKSLTGLRRRRATAFSVVALAVIVGAASSVPWWKATQERARWDAMTAVERVNRAYDPREAAAWRRQFIPPRPPGTDARLLDLSARYNGSLRLGLFATLNEREAVENNWGTLPSGAVTMGDIPFDLRGVIQLSGKNLEARTPGLVPRSVLVPVGRPLQRLHLLHGTQWADPAGTVVARYRLHFDDGTTTEFPVLFERDIMAWWVGWSHPKGDLPNARRVASGGNGALPGAQWTLALYLRSWDNPRPSPVVRALEIESAMAESAPFVAGITVD
jgi:hypothetical protein